MKQRTLLIGVGMLAAPWVPLLILGTLYYFFPPKRLSRNEALYISAWLAGAAALAGGIGGMFLSVRFSKLISMLLSSLLVGVIAGIFVYWSIGQGTLSDEWNLLPGIGILVGSFVAIFCGMLGGGVGIVVAATLGPHNQSLQRTAPR